MKFKIENQAEILKTLIGEDRIEIRSIRSSINNQVTYMTGASFALTGFFIDKNKYFNISWGVDLIIVFLLWVIIFVLKNDIFNVRRCMENREDLLNQLGEKGLEIESINPFPKSEQEETRIKDNDIFPYPILATLGILAKASFIYFSLH